MILNTSYQSPNFDDRENDAQIDMLVIHDTRMNNAKLALERLCAKESKVSAHYLIAKEGVIYYLVDDIKRAWHAGQSYWQGRERLNNYSIGIELDNNGNEPFSKEQMRSLKMLALKLIERYEIAPHNIVAHSDIAPSRKADPNAYLDWYELFENGIGRYSEISLAKNKNLFKPNSKSNKILDLKGRLKKFGYNITNLNTHFDHELAQVIHAFKRRYVPESYHINFWDELADRRLNDLMGSK